MGWRVTGEGGGWCRGEVRIEVGGVCYRGGWAIVIEFRVGVRVSGWGRGPSW